MIVRTLRLVPFLLAVAWASMVVAQGTPPAAPPPSASAEDPSKPCVTARKKLDKEQRSLAAATDALARDKKARESCSSKSMCARYDTSISATEKRKSRHETRVSRFKEDADKACRAPS